MVVTSTFIIPILSKFFAYLEKARFGSFLKLAIDQLLFSPLFTIGIIGYQLFLSKALESYIKSGIIHVSYEQIASEVFVIFPTAMTSSWAFWIPQRIISLSFIPPIYQVLFASACSYVWNVIFSLILSK